MEAVSNLLGGLIEGLMADDSTAREEEARQAEIRAQEERRRQMRAREEKERIRKQTQQRMKEGLLEMMDGNLDDGGDMELMGMDDEEDLLPRAEALLRQIRLLRLETMT